MFKAERTERNDVYAPVRYALAKQRNKRAACNASRPLD